MPSPAPTPAPTRAPAPTRTPTVIHTAMTSDHCVYSSFDSSFPTSSISLNFYCGVRAPFPLSSVLRHLNMHPLQFRASLLCPNHFQVIISPSQALHHF
ncbi:hypothetical protein KSP39_PZI016353 [Platanthera zijinensis]|uniref:Uncharacterized protein n=1 Tax=Platanthera zijinensis TaxID=2320716 RepID=A0AAP0B6T9_9ASPA